MTLSLDAQTPLLFGLRNALRTASGIGNARLTPFGGIGLVNHLA